MEKEMKMKYIEEKMKKQIKKYRKIEDLEI